jgi:uncharacterized protein YqjF (DUF2071 family)
VSVQLRIGDRLDAPDALTRFLTERYRLYAHHVGHLVAAGVEHEPWPLEDATLVRREQTLTRWARLAVNGPPDLLHYSSEAHTRIGPPRAIRGLAAPRRRTR